MNIRTRTLKSCLVKLKTSSVLIIDDELVIRNGISVALSEAGYLVEICATGLDGLKQALNGKYDLILLDIKLPDISGMEILKTVRQKQLETFVIIMTGFATVQNAVEALKIGAYDYLSKPFSSDELIIAVNKAIEHKTLKADNLTLRQQLYQQYDFNKIIGEHPRLKEIFAAISKVSPTDSTVLLDEIANLSFEIQGKLLRVMENHEYKPVGGSHVKKSDVRIIAATNRDLKTMVDDGEFRPDLFYRMNIFPIFLPPLRERKSDIPKLAYHFLRLACKNTGKN